MWLNELGVFYKLNVCGCMLQILPADEFVDTLFKPQWNSDPQLMGE